MMKRPTFAQWHGSLFLGFFGGFWRIASGTCGGLYLTNQRDLFSSTNDDEEPRKLMVSGHPLTVLWQHGDGLYQPRQ